MVHRQTPLQHHFFQVSITERIAQVPSDAQQDDFGEEVRPLEGVFWIHKWGRSGEGQ